MLNNFYTPFIIVKQIHVEAFFSSKFGHKKMFGFILFSVTNSKIYLIKEGFKVKKNIDLCVTFCNNYNYVMIV